MSDYFENFRFVRNYKTKIEFMKIVDTRTK